ncbi:DegT/DnrJ/EryC1/StrS family aminotransferase [Patescibacteria group bacterium AH-259-L05]|nr:DegT/DnrJ/EryC1/StrS family aminotransferase [Patescibacteria group bacterium AH-259-L05]
MAMKYLDLNAQYRSIKKEINQAIQNVLNSGQFILGKEVEKFEKEIAKYCDTKYAIGLNSGTDALLLSLMALDIGPGDKVITTPFTFIATADVIVLREAQPIFVDIDPKTYTLDPHKLEKTIKHISPNRRKKIKAIIPVHIYGQSSDMDAITSIARKYKIKVIEDAAQALGARYKGKPIGSIGDFGCFSFFPSKNLGAYGDGGMIVTNNKKIAEKIKLLRIHGRYQKYVANMLGINSRLDALQAAVLNVKLKYLNSWIRSRQQKAAVYNHALKNIKQIHTPFVEKHNTHAYHQYTIRIKQRNKLQTYLHQHTIPTIIYYPVPLHLQSVFRDLGYRRGDFPEAEQASKEILSLPVYPELSNKNQSKIIKTIKKFYA